MVIESIICFHLTAFPYTEPRVRFAAPLVTKAGFTRKEAIIKKESHQSRRCC